MIILPNLYLLENAHSFSSQKLNPKRQKLSLIWLFKFPPFIHHEQQQQQRGIVKMMDPDSLLEIKVH